MREVSDVMSCETVSPKDHVCRERKRKVIYLVQAVYLFTKDPPSKVAVPDSGNCITYSSPTSRLQRLVSKGGVL
jgi:hypothetical protein